MKVLTSSTVEIAAASVGETSLVQAVQNIEDIKSLDVTLEEEKPEVLETIPDEISEEVSVVENKEELKAAEDGAADAEDAEAPAAEELIQEETPAPVEAPEDEEVFLSEEPTASATTIEEVAEEPAASAPTVEEVAEDPAASATMEEEVAEEPAASAAVVEEASAVESEEAAAEESVTCTEPLPEEAAPAEEEAALTEEATTAEAAPEEETTPAAETPVEEEAAAEETMESEETTAVVVDTSQLAAASSGSDLEVLPAAESESTITSEAAEHEAEHFHSCHSAPSEAVEAAPPAAWGEQLAIEEAVDVTHKVKEEEVSLVEGQEPKGSFWTVKSCSVM
ncbi:hypothetical protein PBY51_020565 [Eleginops maclovinus]|uniref:Uncharacterized protein n=2 Tax=Eleginops maclovinus TaxID=56733 RepID=A0AAN8AND5_ELEMC|nr:hypothetical protein PBY51_020565 [Eleginops maclovinus]